MKKPLVASLASCVLALVGARPAVAAEQILVVDDAHLQMGSGQPLKYSIDAAASLTVDASKYQLKLPKELTGKPVNSLQLILGKDQQFSAPWGPSTKELVLSDKSLAPNPGSKPFGGFRSGQEGVVAIGRMEAGQFSVVWVGMFTVR